MRDCAKRIVEKSKGVIDYATAKELLETVDRAAKRKASEGFDYADSVQGIVKERIENTQTNIAKQKATMAKNMVLRNRAVDRISQFADSGISLKNAFIAELEGINSPIEGTKDSLDVQKNAVKHAYFSRFLGEVNNEGLLEVLNSKALDEEIGRELWALSNKLDSPTGSKEARKIAEIMFNTLDGQRKRLNASGADIAELSGYIMPQRHDVARMAKMGEDEWVSFIEPRLDTSRSFGGDYDNLTDALRGAYRAMVSGIRLDDPTIKDAKLFQFSGPSNLGKRLSHSRQLIFKDFESWSDWNQNFGMRDLNEGVIDSIAYNSENIALMERYGTNPEALLRAVGDGIKKKYRDKVAKDGEQGIQNKLDDLINSALNKNMIPANPRLAQVASNIRAYQNITKLGGAAISSLTDIPMKSLEYQYQGKNWLSATVQPWMDVAEGFKSKHDKLEFASLSGVGFESMVSDIGARFSAQDNMNNKAAKVQRIFFKLNGLSWWTDTHKRAMGRVMGHHLGLKKDTAFSDLDTDTKRLFGNYRITEQDWDTMRAAAQVLDDGRAYILQDFVKSDKVKEKLLGYFADRVDTGVITAGTREQRLATFGTQRGTAIGETVRLMMQFKSFPLTAVTKVWGRTLYGKGKLDVPAMAYMMLMTTAFGYAAGALKDLLKNKTPKDPTQLETFYASLAQGGGLGIMGDILLNDGAAFGRSATSVLAGPTFGTVDEFFKIYSAAIRGEGSETQALRTAVGAVPGNNLFYVRPALDQMLLLQMYEDLNPGYLRRMERNMNNSYGQKLLIK